MLFSVLAVIVFVALVAVRLLATLELNKAKESDPVLRAMMLKYHTAE